MPIDFPGSPTVGQQYTYGGITYTYTAQGVWSQAALANYVPTNATANITAGYTFTPFNAGTKSSGTFTPDPTVGNYQYYTNNGAHTLAAPGVDCAIDIFVLNGATAGVITFTGFTVGASPGDPLTTTNAAKFIISIRRINAIATYTTRALQ